MNPSQAAKAASPSGASRTTPSRPAERSRDPHHSMARGTSSSRPELRGGGARASPPRSRELLCPGRVEGTHRAQQEHALGVRGAGGDGRREQGQEQQRRRARRRPSSSSTRRWSNARAAATNAARAITYAATSSAASSHRRACPAPGSDREGEEGGTRLAIGVARVGDPEIPDGVPGASGDSSGSASAWVSWGSSNLAPRSRGRGRRSQDRRTSAAKTATRSTAARVVQATATRACARSRARPRYGEPPRGSLHAMPDVDFYTASPYLARNADWIGAVVIVIVAVRGGRVVDRAVAPRARSHAASGGG